MSSARQNPPDLASLQSWLRWIFTEPRGVDAALSSPDAARPEPAPRLLSWVADDARFPVPARLNIYANAYFMRLLGVLESNFSLTRRVLGAEKFRALAAGYLMEHPSRSPNIDEIGAALPDFAARHELSREFPFLPDLAVLERAVLAAVFADRAPAFDRRELEALTDEKLPGLRLALDPTASLFQTAWPVDRLWRHRETPETEPLPEISAEPRDLLVFRNSAGVQVMHPQPAPWRALLQFQEGRTMADIFESWEKDGLVPDPADVQIWFRTWMQDGLVSGVRLSAVG